MENIPLWSFAIFIYIFIFIYIWMSTGQEGADDGTNIAMI